MDQGTLGRWIELASQTDHVQFPPNTVLPFLRTPSLAPSDNQLPTSHTQPASPHSPIYPSPSPNPPIPLPVRTSYARPSSTSNKGSNADDELEKKRRRRRGGAGVDIGFLMDYEVPLEAVSSEEVREEELNRRDASRKKEGEQASSTMPPMGSGYKSSDGCSSRAGDLRLAPAEKTSSTDGGCSSASSFSSHQPETPMLYDELLLVSSPRIDGFPSCSSSRGEEQPVSPHSPLSATSIYSSHTTPNTTFDDDLSSSSPSLSSTQAAAVEAEEDDNEAEFEEWDIFADYARASMYAPFDGQILDHPSLAEGDSLRSARSSLVPPPSRPRGLPSTGKKSLSRSEQGSLALLSSKFPLSTSPLPAGETSKIGGGLLSLMGGSRRASGNLLAAEEAVGLGVGLPVLKGHPWRRDSDAGTFGPRDGRRGSDSPTSDGVRSRQSSNTPRLGDSSGFTSSSQHLPSPGRGGQQQQLQPPLQIQSTGDPSNRQRTASANTLRPINTITSSAAAGSSSTSPLSPSPSSSICHVQTSSSSVSSATDSVPIHFFLGQNEMHNHQHFAEQQQQHREHLDRASPTSPIAPYSLASFSSHPNRTSSSTSLGRSPLLGIGLPSSPLASSFVPGSSPPGSQAELRAVAADGKRSVTSPTAATGGASARSRDVSRASAGRVTEQPRPTFSCPADDPERKRLRSKSFGGKVGRESRYPVHPQPLPPMPSPSSRPREVHTNSPSSLPPSPPRIPGFREHRPTIASSLTVKSDLRPPPFPSTAVRPPLPSSDSSIASPRPILSFRTLSSPQASPSSAEPYSPASSGPSLRSLSNNSPSYLPISPNQATSSSSPLARLTSTSPVSHTSNRSVSATSPQRPPPPSLAAAEPTTPKRSIFNIFRSRSASVSATSARNAGALPPSPLPPLPNRTPTYVDLTSPTSIPSSLPALPSPACSSSDAPLPRTPKINTSSLPLASPYWVASPAAGPASSTGAPSNASITTSTTSLTSSSSNAFSPPRAAFLDLESPPHIGIPSTPLKNAKSSSSLKASFANAAHATLRSPKSIVRLRKQPAAASPFGLPVSSRDYQEESVKEGGLEFELVKPLMEKRSDKRPVADHQPSTPHRSTSSSSGLSSSSHHSSITSSSHVHSHATTDLDRPLVLPTDEFGFVLSPSARPTATSPTNSKSLSLPSHPTAGTTAAATAALSSRVKTEQAWVALTKDSGSPSLSANRKKIRKLLSHGGGIPGSMRGTVWSWLLETTIVKGDGMFEVLQDQVGGGSRREKIEGDVARAFPDHVLFSEEGSAGRADLLTVVTRYGVLNAQSRYSMALTLIAGTLLIHSPVEKAFWCLVAVVNRNRNYYSHQQEDIEIDGVAFGWMLEGLDTSLAKRIFGDCKVNPETILSEWVVPLFVRVLPWPALLEIWDFAFAEGPFYLIRLSLTLLSLSRSRLLALPSPTVTPYTYTNPTAASPAHAPRFHLPLIPSQLLPPIELLSTPSKLLASIERSTGGLKEDAWNELRGKARVFVAERRQQQHAESSSSRGGLGGSVSSRFAAGRR